MDIFDEFIGIMACKNRTKVKNAISGNVKLNKFQLVSLNARITDKKNLTILVKKNAILWQVMNQIEIIFGDKKEFFLEDELSS